MGVEEGGEEGKEVAAHQGEEVALQEVLGVEEEMMMMKMIQILMTVEPDPFHL